MDTNIFMSYSRRELGFVDDLVNRLEEKEYNVWLDYRSLVPGAPWNAQIDKGLTEADTVLLVVSKAALASEYVALEWHHFLDMKKRVILLIFEAVDLPKELEQYEWVDFRGSYKAGLDELFSQLKRPIQEEHPVPETGFKAPWIVWVAFVISLIVAVLSVYEWWTLFIPLVLIPLPYKIYKRNFNFTHTQTALAALPFASLLSVFIFSLNNSDVDFDLSSALLDDLLFLPSLIFGLILLFILRSPAMQRWGRPEAIIPKYINPQNPKIQNPAPIPFYVDYVFQDRAIAQDLIAVLKKYGHPQADTIQEAKAVFAIISQFKSDTEANSDKQMLFPILAQTNNKISEKLSKIQWIDFRPGVRGLDTIAQLLPDPKSLLKSLGMRPVSSQAVYSPTITAIYYFVIFLAVVNVGSALHYLVDLRDTLPLNIFVEFALNIVLFLGLAYFIINGLTSRKGFFSSLWTILLGVVGLALLTEWQKQLDGAVAHALVSQLGEEVGGNFIVYIEYVYYLGIAVAGLVFLGNRRDVKHWFPAKK